ncbi:polysaccharide biosynthesis/export family protein [Desulfomicrobium sp. ZS1]|uniref:polysaccharide biosynthesis/export family protein n=1 Tax=Desulfomicrobium sp. ZS1 TaxID=2952228 RepID=UPI0020B3C5DA|nr:polysaccharide biosynthesis/export family protein [Desulfomicrobium sp. ZS1]UTF51203.1 polysaccharide biosynthesis/export family protein [Desulfomicrobium sp. ZS1]
MRIFYVGIFITAMVMATSVFAVAGSESNPAMRGFTGGIPEASQNAPTVQTPTGPSLSPSGPNGARAHAFVIPGAQSQPSPSLAAPPAWAQSAMRPALSTFLPPFGANLFQGNFSNTYHAGLNEDYVIMSGDRIVVRVWGAKTYDDVLIVDQQGNIFIPEVGPVTVGGMRHGQLLSTVQAKLATVFSNNVEIYVNLLSAQPVAVYVTGFVNKPGRYAGGPADSILYYLDKAEGINADRGSYRKIKIMRQGKVFSNLDLYEFALRGNLADLRLQDGDVIFVDEKGPSVAALGLIKQQARYEFKNERAIGNGLMALTSPYNSASHVSVSGVRNQKPFNVYIPVNEFSAFKLEDGDTIEFHADEKGKTMMVSVAGAIQGASRYPIRKDCKLTDLLPYVIIEPNIADVKSVYVRRKSVAMQQKAILTDSLKRLEQSALTATSASVDEANIRVREAELIQDFVKRAAQLEPDGIVVVSKGGNVADFLLEDGDDVIIPQKTHVVHVSGEVLMPKAIAYNSAMTVDDYLKSAGGFSDRADKINVLVAKQNGEIGQASEIYIEPGDRILVMPKFDTKNMQLAKDIMQILYQIAVSTKIAIGF